ncbi:MAG: endonuclease III [Candidatus Limnocylindrales bacterium]
MPTTRPASRASRRRRRLSAEGRARVRAARLRRLRPGLIEDTLVELASMYGHPVWKRVHDPTSELVLTILSQNTADLNAEKAFEALQRRWPSDPATSAAQDGSSASRVNRPGWGGVGIERGAVEWSAVEAAPLDELVDVIRPGGLAQQKAPRIQASLRTVRELRGDYSLEFLGEMAALAALDWLTAIGGVGRKTASVVLLFAFGAPLMPVDRHVERVSKRIGMVPEGVDVEGAHELFLALLEPDQIHEAHVNLITHGRLTCHALRPECGRCLLAPRCRYVDPKAL